MADKRISQLVDRGTVVNNDVIPIVVSGATTTNKATISSIQTFMQGNLDVGVTSVGITLGSSGTDVNVSGSPVTSSGNITINIPSASATNRGLVTTGSQTIAGAKTFSSDLIVNGITVGKGGASNVNNTAVGTGALSANTTGSSNTATGLSALLVNTGGNGNTANGYLSLQSNTTGGYNVSVGNQSMYSNSTGSNNTAVGNDSLYSNITGGKNTGIGSGAGYYIADGSTPNTTSDFSIYLGADTKASADNAQNEIVIGYNAIGNGSNTVTIGNSSITSNKLFGKVIHADAVNANESATLGQVNTALAAYVTLATSQTITAQKTFTTSGGTDSVIISTTGAGFALDAIKAGNGEVIRVNKTSGTGNAMTVIGGNFEAPTIVKTGGTSAQFLKADGSVDSSTYLTTGSAASTYLPLAGGTLTGGVTFAGGVYNFIGANRFFAAASGSINYLYTGSTNLTILNQADTATLFTLANTGAATFASSVTATGGLISNGGAIGYGGGELGFAVTTAGATSGIYTLATASPIIYFDHRATGNTGSFAFRNGTGGGTTLLTIASTGAATFSSSVTAQSFNAVSANPFLVLNDTSGSAAGSVTFQNNGTQKFNLTTIASTNDFALYNNGGTNSFNLYVKHSNGNVGIGTASPGAKLDIAGSDIEMIRLSSSATNGSYISFRNSGTLNGVIGTGSNIIAGISNSDLALWANGLMAFQAGGSERMRITSAGNVGIGTTSPSQRLTVSGGYISQVDGGVSTFLGYDGTGSLVGTTTNHYLRFITKNTERMRITSGGELLINATSNSATSDDGSKFVSNGRLFQVSSLSDNSQESLSMYSTTASAYRFYVGWAGTIFATNTTISSLSDARVKENIRDLDSGLDKIMALKPRLFDWKEGKGKDIKNDRGFIAQEFEEVFPDLIDEYKQELEEGEEPYKSVRADLIPVLVKAIQELKTEIDSLKNQIK